MAQNGIVIQKTMEVALSSVKVSRRIREDTGDLKILAESMDTIGLLHPIVIDSDFNLLSGARRLKAAELLGWKTIEARIVG